MRASIDGLPFTVEGWNIVKIFVIQNFSNAHIQSIILPSINNTNTTGFTALRENLENQENLKNQRKPGKLGSFLENHSTQGKLRENF